MADCVRMTNSSSIPTASIPDLSFDHFRSRLVEFTRGGYRIISLFCMPDSSRMSLTAVLASDRDRDIRIMKTIVQREYPAITPDIPQAHWFEREIAEQWKITPAGHPWLKPIRFQQPMAVPEAGHGPREVIEPGVTDYFQVVGDGIHEVAVGPVHAGVIEPGHFRFQCHGEEVLHLEIELGYQHRGVERALANGPDNRTQHYMETLAGDTSVGHATAYAMVCESLSGIRPSAHAARVRSIALELERLANHTGDLGALAGDVGYLPTASYCGRLRGDFLNITGLVCGNRFGRNLIVPGGIRSAVTAETAGELERRVLATFKDVKNAVQLLWETPSVMSRFEDTGRISEMWTQVLGGVGPAARACGIARDVRTQFPFDAFIDLPVPPATVNSGDVHARARVRWLEIQSSVEFIVQALRNLPDGMTTTCPMTLRPDHIAVSLVEGWRGEICHTVVTDANGRFKQYKIVDPSFHNWFLLALSLRNQQISDFPLCNKSFNLSYCGHDL